MLNPNKSVFFTGHRPIQLWGAYPPIPFTNTKASALYAAHKTMVLEAIDKAVGAGYDTFISGGAQGMDLLGAECVIEQKMAYSHPINLVIARPFPSQHSNKPAASQEHIRTIESKADVVIDVSPDPYSPQKMQIRNQWMVDNAAIGIALWDGTNKGGTFNCVQYAMKAGKFLTIIDPKTLKFWTSTTTG